MSAPLLSIRDLAVQYRTPRGLVDAVRSVSFDVEPGQVTAIVGESGSGKTTVAQSVIGLLASNGQIAGGSVVLNERRVGPTELVGLSERRWRGLRGRCIGLIPQDPGNSLNPVGTIGGSIGESLRIHGMRDRTQRRARVLELLEQVGIDQPEARAKQYPHEFSGGMRQRVLIAAAIANNPELIIADEPTSALDVTVQRTVLDLLDRLRQETGTGVLFITHDLAVAAERAENVVVMRGGEVQESGPSERVLSRPESEYTRQLMRDAPAFGDGPKRERIAVGSGTGIGTATGTEDFAEFSEPVADAAVDAAGGAAPAGGALAAEPATTAPLVTVAHLRQEFRTGRSSEPFVAVDDVSFVVPRGSTHALVGESGSGKTTTGRAIAGFATPTSGSIRVDGTEVTELRGAALREFRKTTQLVYQNPYGSLDPRQTIAQALAEPLRNFGIGSRGDRADRVHRALELVALPAEFAHRRPRELSGGQRQRVAIARALIVEPELVVLDEAVSALDVTVQAQILRLLVSLQQELGLSYVFISHDLAVVRQIADTVSVLQRGRQVEHGPTEQVFSDAQHPYTRQLIEAIPGRTPDWVI
ncbi:ABC transporter ATP-binding protein [Leucobacter rhizosphaerae]|uniref:ABC transporter ATP-binding protein n=1 Tax=Leucobacter rhizosphaerae TaxID=2932245 RepID=A0ABY4FRR1_9MICO|nr:ABC transporter ATP-binding protein [Leucobacter rhizosphaerae]UOQ58978.1 ABC transporter ATP-binding protein [Leucobacter rhizosphaerae]